MSFFTSKISSLSMTSPQDTSILHWDLREPCDGTWASIAFAWDGGWKTSRGIAGIGKCPILGILDITKNSSHLVDHIPNGWVMWNMGTFNDPCIEELWWVCWSTKAPVTSSLFAYHVYQFVKLELCEPQLSVRKRGHHFLASGKRLHSYEQWPFIYSWYTH